MPAAWYDLCGRGGYDYADFVYEKRRISIASNCVPLKIDAAEQAAQ
jgi:hypothetical protein